MTAAPTLDHGFFGHPRGLGYLAFTEAWERFSFFGMQTLLVLYMVGDLFQPEHIGHVVGLAPFRHALEAALGPLSAQGLASIIFGLYSGLAYLLPVFGGILGDRLLGQHSMVMSGVVLAPLVCGTLGELLGWAWGFGAAGVGMLIGLAIYVAGRAHLPADLRRRGTPGTPQRLAPGDRRTLLALLAVLLIVTCFLVPGAQLGNVYPLWVLHAVDRAAPGFVVPVTWFQSATAIVSVVWPPLLLHLWRWQAAGRARGGAQHVHRPLLSRSVHRQQSRRMDRSFLRTLVAAALLSDAGRLQRRRCRGGAAVRRRVESCPGASDDAGAAAIVKRGRTHRRPAHWRFP